MTFYSFAQATRHLGIDAKTLHRWLDDAHLCLQSHPTDGRKKGISEHHLFLLADGHHRQMPTLSQEHPSTLACQEPALPAALLTLAEQVVALQNQIAALQQQVADLTHRLMPPALVPAPTTSAVPPSATPPKRGVTPSSKPTPPPKPRHVIARVEYAEPGHYVVTCPKRGVLALQMDTPEWFAWVAQQESFRFVGNEGHFTAHHEWRVPKGAWRAHRHLRNRVVIQRLAPNHELTSAVLEQAAHALQAQLS